MAALIRPRFAALAVCMVLAPGAVAESPDRVALVIGNSRYENVVSLDNPGNDARDIGRALSRIGFHVTELYDLDARGLNIALRDFSRAASGAEMAVAYFAGHGMEIDRRNYLVPVDAVLEQATDVTFEAVEMQKFLSAARGAKTLRLVLLDACRDNPFLRQMADAGTRSLRRGLGAVEPASGVLVGFSAKGGTVALDGTGRNSPYAEALLTHLETPGLEIGQLFRRVRDTVLTMTNGQQEPFTYGSLPAQDIYLAAAPAPAAPTAAEIYQSFFAADAENSVAAWQEFIARYEGSGGAAVDRARQRLAALQGAAPLPVVPQSDAGSPLIRACDQLAADPADPDRPADAAGVAEDAIDSAAAVTACTLAASGHPDSARSQYQLARALIAAGRPEDARDRLIRSVEQGYPAATAALGKALLERPGRVEQAQRSIDLLDAAVSAGSPEAARALGDFFSRPASSMVLRGRPALDYYIVAAAEGDPVAQYKAGYLLISLALATREQTRQGIAFLEASAAAANKDATLRLASFYLSEKTAPDFRDPEQGIALLEPIALEDPLIARDLATRFRLGDGIPQDLDRGIRWLTRAVELGDPVAMVGLGYFHETGRGVPRNALASAQAYYSGLGGGSSLPVTRRTGDWPRDVAVELQRLLRSDQRARYTGPLDGLVGTGTRAAMARLCGCAMSKANSDFSWLFRTPPIKAR